MTTETKHTPGPWHVVEGRLPGSLEIFSNKTAVAELWRRADVQKEMANASLIAAAPELLEALSLIVESADKNQAAIIDAFLVAAKKAIAKATGETQ